MPRKTILKEITNTPPDLEAFFYDMEFHGSGPILRVDGKWVILSILRPPTIIYSKKEFTEEEMEILDTEYFKLYPHLKK